MNGSGLPTKINQIYAKNLSSVTWKISSPTEGGIITPPTYGKIYQIGNHWFGNITYIENDFYGKLTGDPWIWEDNGIVYSAKFRMLGKGIYHIILEPL